jgi:hypothetical protein
MVGVFDVIDLKSFLCRRKRCSALVAAQRVFAL